MDTQEFAKQAEAFRMILAAIKAERKDVNWYPYESMANVDYIKELIRKIDMPISVLDIGPADGDLGYFFESLGCSVDFLDNAATNYNDCKGIKALKAGLKSGATIIEQDVDWSFELPRQYGLAIAFGILYHLRNPMSFLMTIALHSERLLLSTRICQMTPDGQDIAGNSLAYFLECREANNDPTNYWIFTVAGLNRILKRSGWKVLSSMTVGETDRSDPVERDERMFVYCERIANWQDLKKHHDF